MSYIRTFDGLLSGEVVAKVVEGRVNTVNVMFVDDEGNEKKRGNATPHSFIRRELSFVVRLHLCLHLVDDDDRNLILSMKLVALHSCNVATTHVESRSLSLSTLSVFSLSGMPLCQKQRMMSNTVCDLERTAIQSGRQSPGIAGSDRYRDV